MSTTVTVGTSISMYGRGCN